VRFIIRSARPVELPVLAESFAQAYLQNLLAIPMSHDEALPMADSLRQLVLRAAERPNLLVPVVEDSENGQIAAALAIGVNEELKAAHGLYVWVKEEYRGRAILTRKLFRHTEVMLRKLGATRVEFGVFVSNERALRLYERLGYRTTAHLMMKPLVRDQ
jgi:ribosomal protein S18 acetylase RimI-like enzyme